MSPASRVAEHAFYRTYVLKWGAGRRRQATPHDKEGRSAISTHKPVYLASQELDTVADAPDTVSYGQRNTSIS